MQNLIQLGRLCSTRRRVSSCCSSNGRRICARSSLLLIDWMNVFKTVGKESTVADLKIFFVNFSKGVTDGCCCLKLSNRWFNKFSSDELLGNNRWWYFISFFVSNTSRRTIDCWTDDLNRSIATNADNAFPSRSYQSAFSRWRIFCRRSLICWLSVRCRSSSRCTASCVTLMSLSFNRERRTSIKNSLSMFWTKN